MTFKPDPRQPELTIDPTRRMDVIRRVQLRSVEMQRGTGRDGQPTVRMGSTAHKHLLLLLDHRIGKATSWEMTYEEIAETLELELKTVYRLVGDLDRICLIRRSPGKLGRVEFSICWANLFDLQQEQADSRATENLSRCSEKISRGTATKSRCTENRSRATANAPLIPPVIPPPPPPSPAAEELAEVMKGESPEEEFPDAECPEVDEATIAVQSCGATAAGNAVAIARSNGWADQRILDTVEFFASMRPAWDGGALVNRLRCPGSHHLPIEEGWPPKSKAWEAAQRRAATAATSTGSQDPTNVDPLESRYGAILDGMDEAEITELANATDDRDPGWVASNHRHHEARGKLLKALARREESCRRQTTGAMPSAP